MRLVKRCSSALTALFLTAGSAQGAPAVSDASGGLLSGQTLVIQGSSFGTRGDFHSASDKMARMFDTFNDGGIVDTPYEDWTMFNIEENIAKVVTGGRAGSSDGFYRRDNTGLGNLYIKGTDKDEYYMSYYMRLSDGFDIKSASEGTHQFKILRLYSTNSPINLYPAIGADDGFHMVAEFVEPIVMRYQLQLTDIPSQPKGWHKMAIYYKKNSSPNANDGKCRIWWDNKLVFDWAEHFKDPKNNPDYAPGYPISGDFDIDGANLAGDWALGDYFSSASGSTWVDFDDVVYDHTQARVELGNAPNYAACTTLEVQEPVSWSNGSVTVKANPGALNLSAPVYVYVIDANGSVNSAGHRWGGGPVVLPPAPATAAPAEPRGLRPL